jgi:hypothetical protein
MRTALALALAVLSAAPAAASNEVPARWGAYRLELVDESGRILPTWSHHGRTYTLGRKGERYLVRVRNQSARRAEVVVSVDGRDVVDGRPASFEKRGYLVEPWSEVTIDGYRLSDAAVAAFRFSSVSESYAGRLGDARDVRRCRCRSRVRRRSAAHPRRLPPRRARPRRARSATRPAPGSAPRSARSASPTWSRSLSSARGRRPRRC